MKLLLLIALISFSGYSQDGMVLIGGDVSHQIDTEDALAERVVERWKVEMKVAGIQFQEPLRKIDRIEFINRDYDYFGEIKDRVIYLNSEFHKHPYCKRAAIVQMLYINAGGKVDKTVRSSAIARFKSTDKTEWRFERQYKGQAMFNEVIRNLK